MWKLHQIFLSSTFSDLVDARSRVIEGLLNGGFYPRGMEHFPATGCEQEKYIEKAIDRSSLVVLLLNNRYGNEIDRLDKKSYTHFEYEYARKKNKPILSFINDKIKHDKKESIEQQRKLEELKTQAKKNSICHFFDNKDKKYSALREKIISSVYQNVNDCAVFWINNTELDSMIDSIKIQSVDKATGNYNEMEEIEVQRIMKILKSYPRFTFENFKKQLGQEINLASTSTFANNGVLDLISRLLLNNYIKLDLSDNKGDIVFKVTNRVFQNKESNLKEETGFTNYY
ncbi:hypothetical protein Dacet_0584 [Denitrovibrio acetiphilus DSM 12809]|uniref:DUF4062 domain-containing protein n=2 Tax=Denitrovibrio TaxID=117999 RepID=D4H469_DENA2|nr:hypothetical protein Dacet_0584 [Denitrovibrio acetiphilus DSM 12809]